MDLLGVINQVIQNNMDAQQLTDLAIGTVTKASPIEIQINPNMPPLPEAVLLLSDNVKKRVEDVKIESWFKSALEAKDITVSNDVIGKVEVQHDLKKGDKVLMIRVMKGQQFIVLSKI
jgi:hypothetical protein